MVPDIGETYDERRQLYTVIFELADWEAKADVVRGGRCGRHRGRNGALGANWRNLSTLPPPGPTMTRLGWSNDAHPQRRASGSTSSSTRV